MLNPEQSIGVCQDCHLHEFRKAQGQTVCLATPAQKNIVHQAREGCPHDYHNRPLRDRPDEIAAFLAQPGFVPPASWAKWPALQAAYRKLCAESIAAIPPCPNAGDGRGIVIVGGGRYFVSALTNIRLIRHLGCTLPIMLVGLDGELPDWQRRLVAPHGVTCATWSELAPDHPRGKDHGWELKTVAALYSPFTQSLHLDADSFPQRDPTFLFDDPRFTATGAVFWPDIQNDKHKVGDNMLPAVWEMLGVAVRDIPAIESGQFLIDKSRWWRGLWLSNWICQKGWEYYFRFWHGDKQCPQAASALLDLPYAMPTARPCSGGAPMLLQRDFDGDAMFGHYTQSKWNLDWQGRQPFGAIPQDAATIEIFKQARTDLLAAKPKVYTVGITVAVGYADYLEATIGNLRRLDDWLVVTVPGDPVVALCKAYCVWCTTSDRLHEQGSAFNLGALRNDGLAAVAERYAGRDDVWPIFIDGDCRLPDSLRRDIAEADIDPRDIIGAHRRHANGTECTDVGVTGFFQMFHLSQFPARRYREDSKDAGMSDLWFRDTWPKERQSMLPVTVEHLGTTGVDWKGRVSPAYGPNAKSIPLTPARIAHGIVGLAKSALGIDRASDEVIAKRKATCESCAHLEGGKCSLCSCSYAAKVTLRGEACPIGKWPAVPPS